MLVFIFTANAEINKGRVDGNKTFYSVVNKDINAVYVCEDTDSLSILLETIQSLGKPYYVIDDNKLLNSEVAVITKLHGNSETFSEGCVILNTYDSVKNTYQTYVW
jgi:hypothetical protein